MNDETAWGYTDVDGSFIEVPKPPLIQAGFTEPPFNVTLPSGEVRHITSGPKAAATPAAERPSAPQPIINLSRKIKVYTATKLRHAGVVRDEIARWPEVEVTSRWPFSHVDGDNPLWPEDCAAHGSIFWRHDEEDVQRADIILLFGHDSDVLRGGLVEAGMGLGLGKHVIAVGSNPSYGTWQFHPRVYRVKDLATARSLLALIAADLATKG